MHKQSDTPLRFYLNLMRPIKNPLLQKLEAPKMPPNKQMNSQTGVYACDELLLRDKK